MEELARANVVRDESVPVHTIFEEDESTNELDPSVGPEHYLRLGQRQFSKWKIEPERERSWTGDIWNEVDSR